MEHTRFIGLDIHKERISVVVAESGRSGAVEYLGEIANEPGAISKLCDRLRRPGKPLAFCYEAGPCGYGVHRQLKSLAIGPTLGRRHATPPQTAGWDGEYLASLVAG
jgi:transposase